MSVLEKLSSSLDRKDEKSDEKLAREILQNKDEKSVKELVDALDLSNKPQTASILEVLEEVADKNPKMVAPYVNELLTMLDSNENRLKWASMIVLARIAPEVPDEIWEKKELIRTETENGSVITMDNGVKVLSHVSAADTEYEGKLFPFLLDMLEHCRSKSVPQYAESVLVAVNEKNRAEYVSLLRKRLPELTDSQRTRVEKVIDSFDA